MRDKKRVSPVFLKQIRAHIGNFIAPQQVMPVLGI
jgi:hypothetical protein